MHRINNEKLDQLAYISYWMWGILLIAGSIGAFTIGLGYAWNRDYNSQYRPASCIVIGYRTSYFLTPRYKCYSGYVDFNVTDYSNSEILAVYKQCYSEEYVRSYMTTYFPLGKAFECNKNVNYDEIRLSLYDTLPSLIVGIIFLSISGPCLLYLLIYYALLLSNKLFPGNNEDVKI